MADLEERLALHGHLLAAATALNEAEQRLVTALGYAQTLSGEDARSSELIERLTEEAQRVRAASKLINEWLDGVPM